MNKMELLKRTIYVSWTLLGPGLRLVVTKSDRGGKGKCRGKRDHTRKERSTSRVVRRQMLVEPRDQKSVTSLVWSTS